MAQEAKNVNCKRESEKMSEFSISQIKREEDQKSIIEKPSDKSIQEENDILKNII